MKWKPPDRLMSTSGSKWKYQESQAILDELGKTLPFHFDNWKQKQTDKQSHPLYLIWSGPGTGKSRLLEEFSVLCTKSVKDKDLAARLSNAYIFKISFENGTRIQVSNDGNEVGTRMLFQLLGESKDWDKFAKNKENWKTPIEVITALAQGEGKKLEDMTVFILVDGIQELSHKNRETNSMKSAINSVVQIVNMAPFFCIAAIAGTFYGNVADVLSRSPQMRIYLTPPPLDGRAIIQSKDPLVQQLIDDMGGHGRALEALEQELQEVDITKCSASSFMNNIRASLERKYPPLQENAPRLVPALIAVLIRYPLGKEDQIPNSDMTVDSIVQLGLFRHENRVLTCPFVFVWLLATWSQHPTLAHFKLEAYDERQQKADPGLPVGLQCWQHWEEMTGQFRMLKSSLLKGKTIPISELHAGALLGKEAQELKVKVTELEELLRATGQYLIDGK